MLQLAKFIFHSESKIRLGTGERPYSDIAVVRELRVVLSDLDMRTKKAPERANVSLKWLEWPEYLALVGRLKQAALQRVDWSGGPLRTKVIADNIQKYLIFAILSCVPDRQRTLRELVVGRTLLKRAGEWIIKHGPNDYKTGKTHGDRSPLILSKDIYPLLEEYIDVVRPQLNPQHEFLFTLLDGSKPLGQSLISLKFTSVAHKLTGKKTNPGLVRDMIVAYLRRQEDITEHELEALALYMGHSVQTQKRLYDRRTRAEGVRVISKLSKETVRQAQPAHEPTAHDHDATPLLAPRTSLEDRNALLGAASEACGDGSGDASASASLSTVLAPTLSPSAAERPIEAPTELASGTVQRRGRGEK
jgi:hypothetical protein